MRPAGTHPDGRWGPLPGARDIPRLPHPAPRAHRGFPAERTVRSIAVMTRTVAASPAASITASASVAIMTGVVAATATASATSCGEKVGWGAVLAGVLGDPREQPRHPQESPPESPPQRGQEHRLLGDFQRGACTICVIYTLI